MCKFGGDFGESYVGKSGRSLYFEQHQSMVDLDKRLRNIRDGDLTEECLMSIHDVVPGGGVIDDYGIYSYKLGKYVMMWSDLAERVSFCRR